MNIQSIERLFASMLDQQVELGNVGTINRDRFKRALTSGPDLTEKEKRILLVSPIARYEYHDIKREVLASIEQKIEEQHINTEIVPLAASDDSADRHIFPCTGFRVTMYDKKKYGIPWILLLQLDTTFMNIINPMTVVRLVDSGGQEWLLGKPDKNGELTASWLDTETDLLDRVRRFSLNIELV